MKMDPRLFVCSLLLAVLHLHGNDAYIPRMLNGRPRGGFLGSPGGLSRFQTRIGVAAEQWFVQPLNHFDQSDTRTWRQKYYENSAFYRKGGPLFVQIGGEGKANPIWVTNGAWMEYAQTYNAYCVLVEHRFYGDSHPTADMATENLKYLSSEQALADLSNLITSLKQKLNGPKVIVFGGSYSGALAAWFRMKYPHLADGAIATSAPVLAKLDFKEYLEVVDSSLTTHSESCETTINLAVALIVHYVKSAEGRAMMKKKFQLCSDIDPDNHDDIANLFSTLANNVLGVVQYNKDNRAFEGAKDSGVTIDTLCGIMTNNTLRDPVDRYAEINAMMMRIYGEKCQDFKYSSMIKEMQLTAWNSSAAEGGRQWVYQTCTEFAYFQSSDSMAQPFGHFFPLQFSIDQCVDIYGSQYTQAVIGANVNKTNVHYGGREPKVTRVLFPNGSIDPWHALGVLKDLNPEARAIYIQGTAHCANMYPPSPSDLPGLVKARQEIKKTIGTWLA